MHFLVSMQVAVLMMYNHQKMVVAESSTLVYHYPLVSLGMLLIILVHEQQTAAQ